MEKTRASFYPLKNSSKVREEHWRGEGTNLQTNFTDDLADWRRRTNKID